MAWRLAKSVEETLNLMLLGGGKLVPIENLDCNLNATLVGDPIFRAGLMAVPMDGSFISNQDPQPNVVSEQPLPISVGDVSKTSV